MKRKNDDDVRGQVGGNPVRQRVAPPPPITTSEKLPSLWECWQTLTDGTVDLRGVPLQEGLDSKQYSRQEVDAFIAAAAICDWSPFLDDVPLECRTQQVLSLALAKEVGRDKPLRLGFHDRFWRHIPLCWREVLGEPKPDPYPSRAGWSRADMYFLDALAKGIQACCDADTLACIHWSWYETALVKEFVSEKRFVKALKVLPSHMLTPELCLAAVRASGEAFALCPKALRCNDKFVQAALSLQPYLMGSLPVKHQALLKAQVPELAHCDVLQALLVGLLQDINDVAADGRSQRLTSTPERAEAMSLNWKALWPAMLQDSYPEPVLGEKPLKVVNPAWVGSGTAQGTLLYTERGPWVVVGFQVSKGDIACWDGYVSRDDVILAIFRCPEDDMEPPNVECMDLSHLYCAVVAFHDSPYLYQRQRGRHILYGLDNEDFVDDMKVPIFGDSHLSMLDWCSTVFKQTLKAIRDNETSDVVHYVKPIGTSSSKY